MQYSTILGTVAVGAGLVGVVSCSTPAIYDAIIVKMTARWYEVVLGKLPHGAVIADIGIGTASALIANKKILVAKDIKVIGFDYDASYIRAAKAAVSSHGLEDHVQLHCLSIYDDYLLERKNEFDATYFSGSFSLLPDPLRALEVAAHITRAGGHIYITQTYQKAYIPGFAAMKPLLKYLTTIDFGQLTYEKDIERILSESGMPVLHNAVIPKSVDNTFQCARLIILKP
ncbi:hypothetical protein DIPPA_01750 [Diplonema papillatum]|nr:hypothetical protein DIPPA_01750 [Diplonema papillatum]